MSDREIVVRFSGPDGAAIEMTRAQMFDMLLELVRIGGTSGVLVEVRQILEMMYRDEFGA